MTNLPTYIQIIIYEYDPTYKLFIWQKLMKYIKNGGIQCDCGSVSFIHHINYKKQIYQYMCPNCDLDWYV